MCYLKQIEVLYNVIIKIDFRSLFLVPFRIVFVFIHSYSIISIIPWPRYSRFKCFSKDMLRRPFVTKQQRLIPMYWGPCYYDQLSQTRSRYCNKFSDSLRLSQTRSRYCNQFSDSLRLSQTRSRYCNQFSDSLRLDQCIVISSQTLSDSIKVL